MTGTPPALPSLYLPAEVAAALRCSTWWVMEQVRRGRFPYCEVAGGYRFKAEHYESILRLVEKLPPEELPSAWKERPAIAAVEAATGGLQARVPRRLREVSPINPAA